MPATSAANALDVLNAGINAPEHEYALQVNTMLQLTSLQERVATYSRFQLSDQARSFLEHHGIAYDRAAAGNHSHPLSKTIAEYTLACDVPSLIQGPCTFSFIKKHKMAMVQSMSHHRDTTQDCLANYWLTPDDRARYPEAEMAPFRAVQTPYCFMDEAVHHMTPRDIINLFEMSPILHTLVATLVIPPELLHGLRTHSNPLYSYKCEGETLVYAPDGVWGEAYCQPISCTWLLETALLRTSGITLTLRIKRQVGSVMTMVIQRGMPVACPSNQLVCYDVATLVDEDTKRERLVNPRVYSRTLQLAVCLKNPTRTALAAQVRRDAAENPKFYVLPSEIAFISKHVHQLLVRRDKPSGLVETLRSFDVLRPLAGPVGYVYRLLAGNGETVEEEVMRLLDLQPLHVVANTQAIDVHDGIPNTPLFGGVTFWKPKHNVTSILEAILRGNNEELYEGTADRMEILEVTADTSLTRSVVETLLWGPVATVVAHSLLKPARVWSLISYLAGLFQEWYPWVLENVDIRTQAFILGVLFSIWRSETPYTIKVLALAIYDMLMAALSRKLRSFYYTQAAPRSAFIRSLHRPFHQVFGANVTQAPCRGWATFLTASAGTPNPATNDHQPAVPNDPVCQIAQPAPPTLAMPTPMTAPVPTQPISLEASPPQLRASRAATAPAFDGPFIEDQTSRPNSCPRELSSFPPSLARPVDRSPTPPRPAHHTPAPPAQTPPAHSPQPGPTLDDCQWLCPEHWFQPALTVHHRTVTSRVHGPEVPPVGLIQWQTAAPGKENFIHALATTTTTHRDVAKRAVLDALDRMDAADLLLPSSPALAAGRVMRGDYTLASMSIPELFTDVPGGIVVYEGNSRWCYGEAPFALLRFTGGLFQYPRQTKFRLSLLKTPAALTNASTDHPEASRPRTPQPKAPSLEGTTVIPKSSRTPMPARLVSAYQILARSISACAASTSTIPQDHLALRFPDEYQAFFPYTVDDHADLVRLVRVGLPKLCIVPVDFSVKVASLPPFCYYVKGRVVHLDPTSLGTTQPRTVIPADEIPALNRVFPGTVWDHGDAVLVSSASQHPTMMLDLNGAGYFTKGPVSRPTVSVRGKIHKWDLLAWVSGLEKHEVPADGKCGYHSIRKCQELSGFPPSDNRTINAVISSGCHAEEFTAAQKTEHTDTPWLDLRWIDDCLLSLGVLASTVAAHHPLQSVIRGAAPVVVLSESHFTVYHPTQAAGGGHPTPDVVPVILCSPTATTTLRQIQSPPAPAASHKAPQLSEGLYNAFKTHCRMHHRTFNVVHARAKATLQALQHEKFGLIRDARSQALLLKWGAMLDGRIGRGPVMLSGVLGEAGTGKSYGFTQALTAASANGKHPAVTVVVPTNKLRAELKEAIQYSGPGQVVKTWEKALYEPCSDVVLFDDLGITPQILDLFIYTHQNIKHVFFTGDTAQDECISSTGALASLPGNLSLVSHAACAYLTEVRRYGRGYCERLGSAGGHDGKGDICDYRDTSARQQWVTFNSARSSTLNDFNPTLSVREAQGGSFDLVVLHVDKACVLAPNSAWYVALTRTRGDTRVLLDGISASDLSRRTTLGSIGRGLGSFLITGDHTLLAAAVRAHVDRCLPKHLQDPLRKPARTLSLTGGGHGPQHLAYEIRHNANAKMMHFASRHGVSAGDPMTVQPSLSDHSAARETAIAITEELDFYLPHAVPVLEAPTVPRPAGPELEEVPFHFNPTLASITPTQVMDDETLRDLFTETLCPSAHLQGREKLFKGKYTDQVDTSTLANAIYVRHHNKDRVTQALTFDVRFTPPRAVKPGFTAGGAALFQAFTRTYTAKPIPTWNCAAYEQCVNDAVTSFYAKGSKYHRANADKVNAKAPSDQYQVFYKAQAVTKMSKIFADACKGQMITGMQTQHNLAQCGAAKYLVRLIKDLLPSNVILNTEQTPNEVSASIGAALQSAGDGVWWNNDYSVWDSQQNECFASFWNIMFTQMGMPEMMVAFFNDTLRNMRLGTLRLGFMVPSGFPYTWTINTMDNLAAFALRYALPNLHDHPNFVLLAAGDDACLYAPKPWMRDSPPERDGFKKMRTLITVEGTGYLSSVPEFCSQLYLAGRLCAEPYNHLCRTLYRLARGDLNVCVLSYAEQCYGLHRVYNQASKHLTPFQQACHSYNVTLLSRALGRYGLQRISCFFLKELKLEFSLEHLARAPDPTMDPDLPEDTQLSLRQKAKIAARWAELHITAQFTDNPTST